MEDFFLLIKHIIAMHYIGVHSSQEHGNIVYYVTRFSITGLMSTPREFAAVVLIVRVEAPQHSGIFRALRAGHDIQVHYRTGREDTNKMRKDS